MIYLGFLLHIYQPPNQFGNVLDKIVNECYRPLLKLIVDAEEKFTLNINWSLTEKLIEGGCRDIPDAIRRGMESGALEMTGSAAYHAILPLIPEDERKRQIDLNEQKHKALWGKLYSPQGFFPPEMAYGPEILPLMKRFGYRWLITDDVPYQCIHETVPMNVIPFVDGLGFFLRSGLWSNRIALNIGEKLPGDRVARWLLEDLGRWFSGRDGYIVLAMDGETFGHHHPGYIEEFMIPFLATLKTLSEAIRLVHLSEIFNLFPKVEGQVPPGSWSTSSEDFWNGNFFPLWKNPKNQAHHLLWQLTQLALSSVDQLRDKMDRSLNSCTFWWAATKPEACSPITLMGMDMLVDVIRLADPAHYEKAKSIRHELEKALNIDAAKSGRSGLKNDD